VLSVRAIAGGEVLPYHLIALRSDRDEARTHRFGRRSSPAPPTTRSTRSQPSCNCMPMRSSSATTLFFTGRREQLVALTSRYAVPAIERWREFAASNPRNSSSPCSTNAASFGVLPSASPGAPCPPTTARSGRCAPAGLVDGHWARGCRNAPPGLRPPAHSIDDRGWRATFYTTGMEHSPMSATGTAWERTPWRATLRAA